MHTRDNIIKLFELDSSKVHLYKIHIDEIFKPGIKTNTVSYMPRKNRAFGCFVINYLCGKYPEVEYVAIDNMNREQVAEVLGRSKIFLSFGGPEGFGMPPLEAALAGCKVIGFDGGGGEEFFNRPIFNKIPFYDHMELLK
jgi:glycosyltransferase involved in cell wall biosynthesis